MRINCVNPLKHGIQHLILLFAEYAGLAHMIHALEPSDHVRPFGLPRAQFRRYDAVRVLKQLKHVSDISDISA